MRALSSNSLSVVTRDRIASVCVCVVPKVTRCMSHFSSGRTLYLADGGALVIGMPSISVSHSLSPVRNSRFNAKWRDDGLFRIILVGDERNNAEWRDHNPPVQNVDVVTTHYSCFAGRAETV